MNNSDSHWLCDFSSQIVLFPSYHHAYTVLQKSVETTRQRGIPTSAMVIGPSGCGKSTLCKLFRDSFGGPYEFVNAEGVVTIRPAFYCSVPSPVTVKSFAKTVVRGLGCWDTSGDTVELTYRLMTLLKTCGVEVCEFDEFQWLVRPEAEKARNIIIDWLITIINDTQIPFILAGTPECKVLLDHREALARRFPYLIELNHLSYSEARASDYMTLLSKLDELIYSADRLSSGAHLTDTDIAVRLYAATAGSLEYIRMILHGALQHAIAHNRSGLALDDFGQACGLINMKKSLLPNPFFESIGACYQKIYGENHENS
ncbi:TniB family NTP-binding protein [Pseudomonas lini]